jgi:hypothetical protein
MEKILRAGEGLLWSSSEEDRNDVSAALHELEKSILTPGCVYFVWDFAPQIHFKQTGYTMPKYGTTDAFCLDSEEFGEYLRAACTGRISYIFVATETMGDEVTGTSSEELEKSQQEKKDGKGLDGILSGTLSKEGSRSTAPLQQPLLPKQASQKASSQGNAVKIDRGESAGTGNTIHPGPHGGYADIRVRASDSGINGDIDIDINMERFAGRFEEFTQCIIACFAIVVVVVMMG